VLNVHVGALLLPGEEVEAVTPDAQDRRIHDTKISLPEVFVRDEPEPHSAA
jgi:hypothetical protein